MAQLDGNSPGGGSAAESSGTRTMRVTRLPPPPVAGVRSVARLRGAFDEGLPTLRLPTLPPQAKSDERGVAPRAGETMIGRPMSPASILRSGPRVLAQPVLRLRMGGPLPFDPVEIEGGLRDLVEEPEELDASDLVEADATPDETLTGVVDPADTAALPVDPGATWVGGVDSDDTIEAEVMGVAPDASVHGAPHFAIATDLTPVVNVVPLAVPAPTVIAHAIVEPPAPESRSWSFALQMIAAGIIAITIVAAAWRSGPEPTRVANITASWPTADAPVVATPTAVVPAAVVVPVPIVAPAAVVVPPAATAPAQLDDAPVVASPPTMPPAPAVETRAPAPTKPSKIRKRVRTPRARTPAAAPTPAPAGPVARAPTPASNDAAALLREAERAYADGRYATALHFADRSRAKSPEIRAIRIAVLAACRTGQAKKAMAAFAALPAAQRKSVRESCHERGIELP